MTTTLPRPPSGPASRHAVTDTWRAHLPWALATAVATVAVNLGSLPAPRAAPLYWPAAAVGLAWLMTARESGRLTGATAGLVVVVGSLQLASATDTGFALRLVLAQVLAPGAALAVLAATTRRRLGVRVPDLHRRRDLLLLALASACGACVSAPLAGAVADDVDGLGATTVAQWAGRCTLAMALNGATLLLLRRLWRERLAGRTVVEQLVVGRRRLVVAELLLLTATTVAVGVPLVPLPPGPPAVLLLLACTVWAGARFTPVVAAVHATLLSVLVVRSASRGTGVFGLVATPDARVLSATMLVGLAAAMAAVLSTGYLRQQRLTTSLQQATERYERLLGQLADNIWSVDLSPDGSSRLLFASRPGGPGTGGIALGPLGSDVVARVRASVLVEDRPRLDEFLDHLRRHGSAEVEYRVRAQDGSVAWAWARAIAHRHGDGWRLEGITSEITDLKALDELRVELAAVVGHELRTPLTVVRGYAELLAEGLEPGSERAVQVAAITRRAEQMQQLVADYAALATTEAASIGGPAPDPLPVDLAELVEELVAEHQPGARARGVAVDAAPVVDDGAVDDGGVVVLGDRARLRQAVDNLIENAVKYGRPGGRALVAVRASRDRVLLSVDDDGIGVPASELPNLFGRFYRASTGRASQAGGTGLGLAVVKAVAESHGGTVEARTGPAGGLCVTVDLPRSVAATAPGPPPESTTTSVGAAQRG